MAGLCQYTADHFDILCVLCYRGASEVDSALICVVCVCLVVGGGLNVSDRQCRMWSLYRAFVQTSLSLYEVFGSVARGT